MISCVSTGPNWRRSVDRPPVAHAMRDRGSSPARRWASPPSGQRSLLFLSAASTPAAFAVTGNSDGTFSVVLHRIAGIKGANERLAALGVRAKFVQVVAGCRAALPPAALANIKTPDQVLIHAGRQTRIDPRKIPPGRMLMIVSWYTARHGARRQVGPRGEGSPGLHRRPRAACVAFRLGSGPRVPHRGGQGAAQRGHRGSTGRCLDGHASGWRRRHHRHGSGPQEERRTHRQQRTVHREQRRRPPGTAGRLPGTAAPPPATAGRSPGTAARPPATVVEPGAPARLRSRSGWPKGARSRIGCRSHRRDRQQREHRRGRKQREHRRRRKQREHRRGRKQREHRRGRKQRRTPARPETAGTAAPRPPRAAAAAPPRNRADTPATGWLRVRRAA